MAELSAKYLYIYRNMNENLIKTFQSILLWVEDLHLRGDDDFKRAEIRKLVQESIIRLRGASDDQSNITKKDNKDC